MALTALGLLVVSLSLQLVVHRVVEGNVDRVLEDRAESVVAAVSAGTRGPDLTVPATVLDPGVVVYDAAGRLRAGLAPARVREQVATAGGRPAAHRPCRSARPSSSTPRRSPPAAAPRAWSWSSETLAPYEQTEQYVGLASTLVGLLVVGGGRADHPLGLEPRRWRPWRRWPSGPRTGASTT